MASAIRIQLPRQVHSISLVDQGGTPLPAPEPDSTDPPAVETTSVSAEETAVLVDGLQAQLAQTCQVLNSVVAKLKEFHERSLASHSEDIARLSIEIARKILAQKVQEHDYEIVSIVQEALNTAPVHSEMTVHVHPDDVAEFLKEVDADDDIAWAEPDPKIKGNTGRTDKNMGKDQEMPANLELIGLGNSGKGKDKNKNKFEFKNVEIYILDTGVDNDDLNIVETRDFVADTTGDSSLEDFGLGILSDDARDADGHGTHIAGIAAAIDDDDGLIGVAAGAPIHDFRVLDENGEADFSTVIAAVELITQRKLDDPKTPIVVNISFGADVGTRAYNGLDEAIEASINVGVVYVIAAGNDDVDAANVTPAHVAEAITVGSVNKKKRFSSFSNYGSLIDIFAPGEDIESLSPDHNKILIMTGT